MNLRALLSVPVAAWMLSSPAWADCAWPERCQEAGFPGVTGNTGNDLTISAWKQLKTFVPQKPLKEIYVSSAAGGDIRAIGTNNNPGTYDEPLLDWAGIREMVKAHGCGFDFILDSDDPWNSTNGLTDHWDFSTDSLACPPSWRNDIGVRIRASNPDKVLTITTVAGDILTWHGADIDCSGVATGVAGSTFGIGGTGVDSLNQAWLVYENVALHGTCQWQGVQANGNAKVALLNVLVNIPPGASEGLAHAIYAETANAGGTGGGSSHILGINTYTDHTPWLDTQGTAVTKLGKSYMVMIGGSVFMHDQTSAQCLTQVGPEGAGCDANTVYVDSCGGATFVDYTVRGDKVEAATSTTPRFLSKGFVVATGTDTGGWCNATYAPTDIGLRVDNVRTLVTGLPTWADNISCKGGAYYGNPATDTLNGYQWNLWQVRSIGGSAHFVYCPVGSFVAPVFMDVFGYAVDFDLDGQTKGTNRFLFGDTVGYGVCVSTGAQNGLACKLGELGSACLLDTGPGVCNPRTNLRFTARDGVYDDGDATSGFQIEAINHANWANACASDEMHPAFTPFFGDADSPATCPAFNDGVSRDINGDSNGIFYDGNNDLALGNDTVSSFFCADGQACDGLLAERIQGIPLAFPEGMPPFVSNGLTVRTISIQLGEDAGG